MHALKLHFGHDSVVPFLKGLPVDVPIDVGEIMMKAPYLGLAFIDQKGVNCVLQFFIGSFISIVFFKPFSLPSPIYIKRTEDRVNDSESAALRRSPCLRTRKHSASQRSETVNMHNVASSQVKSRLYLTTAARLMPFQAKRWFELSNVFLAAVKLGAPIRPR